jgi:hypothetical protein
MRVGQIGKRDECDRVRGGGSIEWREIRPQLKKTHHLAVRVQPRGVYPEHASVGRRPSPAKFVALQAHPDHLRLSLARGEERIHLPLPHRLRSRNPQGRQHRVAHRHRHAQFRADRLHLQTVAQGEGLEVPAKKVIVALSRKKRIWRKKINYDCRKKVADNRLRVKGKFVTS